MSENCGRDWAANKETLFDFDVQVMVHLIYSYNKTN